MKINFFVAPLLSHNTLRYTAVNGTARAAPAVAEADREAASMDDSMETDWLHRIDVEERSTREDGGARVDFRSAELSKVNDDGEGSSSGGGKGQDLGMPQAYAQCKASRESELKKRAIETSAVPNFETVGLVFCPSRRDESMFCGFEGAKRGKIVQPESGNLL